MLCSPAIEERMAIFRHRWSKIVALVGVMLHAYAFVGHRAQAYSMAFAQADAPAGSIVICRADGAVETVPLSKVFNGGSHKPAKSAGCPLCCAAAPAFAMIAPAAFAFMVLGSGEAPPISEPTALPVARASKPPATGPPALV